MKEEQIRSLLLEGDTLMNEAREESNKAREDVVNHLVCMNTRNSIKNYLQAFLLQNDVAAKPSDTLPDLLGQCQSISNDFSELDLTPIDCRFDDSGNPYCQDDEKVKECFDVAEKTREICAGKMKLMEEFGK